MAYTAQWIHFLFEKKVAHRDGYTLYKVTGFRQCSSVSGIGDCVQKATIWQRYSKFLEFEKLLKDVFKNNAVLNDAPFLKRPAAFRLIAKNEVNERMRSLETLFDFISSVQSLDLTNLLDKFFNFEVSQDNISDENDLSQSSRSIDSLSSVPEMHHAPEIVIDESISNEKKNLPELGDHVYGKTVSGSLYDRRNRGNNLQTASLDNLSSETLSSSTSPKYVRFQVCQFFLKEPESKSHQSAGISLKFFSLHCKCQFFP